MRSRVLLAAAGALVALAAPPPASAARLSDEHSYTRTAEVGRLAVVRVRPRADSRVVARLHRWTEDRWPEVYLLLRSSERVKGHRWIEIRLSRAAARPAARSDFARPRARATGARRASATSAT